MADHRPPFEARLRDSLDISSPDITPDPSILPGLRARMKGRGSMSHLLSRNGFAPAPLGSFGAIAAAAVLALFVWTGTRHLPVTTDVADAYVAAIDTSQTLDSIAIHTQFGLVTTDSLLSPIHADSSSQ